MYKKKVFSEGKDSKQCGVYKRNDWVKRVILSLGNTAVILPLLFCAVKSYVCAR